MDKKKNKIILLINIFKLIFYILTILAIILFLYVKRGELRYLASIHFINLLLLLFMGVMSISINALLFKNNISIFNVHLSFKEWYGLTISNTMYNYLLPARGGLALRAIYLKQNYNFPFSHYISFTAGTYILSLFLFAFLATFLSLILLLTNKLNNNFIFFYISLALLIIIIGLILYLYKFNPNRMSEKNKIYRFIKNAAKGIKIFKKNPQKVRNLLVIQFAFLISISLRLFIAYYVLDIHVSFIKLVFINSLVIFSQVFSLTPGNIGIKEGIIGLSVSLLGISIDKSFLGVVLDRVVTMILVFGIGLIFSRILLKRVYFKD